MKFISVLIVLFSLSANADVLEDFDSLGGNKILVEKAQALAPDAKVSIVQNRIVNRTIRHEFSPKFSQVIGGEPYLNTNSAGVGYQFHLNPRWSFGAQYSYFFNKLSKEGQQLLDLSTGKAEALELPLIPDLNWQKQGYTASVNFYPMYGKINVFDKAIVHFDIYATLGAGKVELRRGDSNTTSAGLGMGFWFSQHLTGRLEYKVKNYKSESLTSSKNLNLTSLGFSLGYML